MISINLSITYASDFGAGNEIRTRDPDLGKVVLYQLSYSRTLKSYTSFGLCPLEMWDAFYLPNQNCQYEKTFKLR